MLPNYFSSGKAWSRLALNFIKWSIPGTIGILLVLIVVIISVVGEDGTLLGIGNDIKWPNGILSFMSIAMMASGIIGFFMIWQFHVTELQSVLEIIGIGLVCIGIGLIMLNCELKRLH
jgi:hypothetical protein